MKCKCRENCRRKVNFEKDLESGDIKITFKGIFGKYFRYVSLEDLKKIIKEAS